MDFEDAFVGTEAQPLVADGLSMWNTLKRLDDKLDELRRLMESRIARDGAFRITKESGLFEAFNECREN